MTPDQFIQKWSLTSLKESAAAKEHFLDLCALLQQPTPAEADPGGDWYTFEKGASKAGGGDGFADVWRKGCFAWEYKGPNKDLNLAYGQLVKYAGALENPPLLVVSDTKLIRIYTSFTNTTQRKIEIPLETINQPAQLDILRRLFDDPESLNPALTSEALTAEAAATVAELAEALRNRGIHPARTAHFLMQTMFCFFAEDAGLLPGKLPSRLLKSTHTHPQFFAPSLRLSYPKTGVFRPIDRVLQRRPLRDLRPARPRPPRNRHSQGRPPDWTPSPSIRHPL